MNICVTDSKANMLLISNHVFWINTSEKLVRLL